MIHAYLARHIGAPEIVRRRTQELPQSGHRAGVLVSPLLYTVTSRRNGESQADWPSTEPPLATNLRRQRVLMSPRLFSSVATAVGTRPPELFPLISAVARRRSLSGGEAVICRLPDCTVTIEKRGGAYIERVTSEPGTFHSRSHRPNQIVGHYDFRAEFAGSGDTACGRGRDDVVSDPLVQSVLDRPGAPAKTAPARPRRWRAPAVVVAAALISLVLWAAVSLSARSNGSPDLPAPADLRAATPRPPQSSAQSLQDELARLDYYVGIPAIPLLRAIVLALPPGTVIEQFDVEAAQVGLTVVAGQDPPLDLLTSALRSAVGAGAMSPVAVTVSAEGIHVRYAGTLDFEPVQTVGLREVDELWDVDDLSMLVQNRRAAVRGNSGNLESAVSEIAEVARVEPEVRYESTTNDNGGELRFRMDGPIAAISRLLPALDELASGPGRFVRSFGLTSFHPQDQARIEVSLVLFSGNIEAPPMGTNLSEREVSAARASWATVTTDRIADALGASPLVHTETAEIAGPQIFDLPARSTDAAGAYSGRVPGALVLPAVRYLGVVRNDSADRFAVRLVDEDVVTLLGEGDTAFGWSLVEATDARLKLARAEDEYEVSRD